MGIFQNLVVDALVRHFPRLRESLRVNLLRGKLHIEDVDVAPSFLILNSLPLQVNDGNIGSLSVQVPWTKLFSSPIRVQAENFRLSLTEVPFPSCQRAVFDAFASESENEKKRQLAEGERGKSPISRVLTRILPMLLDRFELDIKNVTIELKFADGALGIMRLDELSTKPTPHAANRGDLDKLIIASGFSFTITSETTQPVLCLSETSISFNATHRGGAWHIDLDVPNFKLEVDYSFPCFLRDLLGRSLLWHTTYLHRRPNVSVEDNPRSWFQYVVRRVTTAFCKRRIYFSEVEARRKARSFVKYKELHVKRLRRITDADEALQILELERSLGADAILVLRDQARKHALADEVSSFATRDWLGWALLGTDVSQEQEHIAEELKHSLTVAKYGQASSASQEISDLSTAWSKVRFEITVPIFHVVIADELSKLSVNVNAISLQAELDSSLESYNGSLCIESAKLLDRERVIWIGVPDDETYRPVAREGQRHNFLELKLYKLGYEKKVTRSLKVQSSRAELEFMAEDGFESMRRIATFANSFGFLSSSAGDEDSKPLRPAEVGNVTQVKTYINLARFTLLIGSTGHQPRGSSLNICCSLSDVYAEIESGEIEKSLQRGTLDISAHKPSLSTVGSAGTGTVPYSPWSEESKIFQVAASFRADTMENRIELDVTDGTGFLELSNTVPFINSVSDAQRQFFLRVVPQFDDCLRDGIYSGRGSRPRQSVTYVLKAPSVEFKLRDSDGEGKITEVARVKLGGILYEGEGRLFHVIRVQRLEIYESLYHDSVLLLGSEFAIDVDEREGFGLLPGRVESNIEKLNVSLSVNGLSTISSIADRSFKGLRRPLGKQLAVHGENLSDHTSSEGNIATAIPFSVRLRRTVLRVAAYDVCTQTTFENMFLTRQDNMFTGFLDNLEVKDASDLAAQYKTLLRCVTPERGRSPRRKGVSFVTSNRTSNIQLSGLQIIWLKSVVSSMSRMHQLFESTMNDIHTKISGASPDHRSKEGTSELHQTHESGPITIQGWDLTLIVPLTAISSEAVCISSSHITATVSPKGQVISVRGGQILTRADSSQEQTFAPKSRGPRVSQWVVLVREIDTDFSHHSDLQTRPSEHKRSIRDKWSIEILRRVSLLIAPSQVLILQRFISNTFSADKYSLSNDEANRNELSCLENVVESDWRSRSQEESDVHQLISIEECSLECETHHISIELLVESATSTTAPTSIAVINFDPSKLSWKRSSKYNGTQCETDVISWRLRSTSVSLEDRTNEDPGTRRMIVHTRQETDGSRSFHELGTEIQSPKTAISIEAIQRTDSETRTTSSCVISLHRAQVVVCPTLFLPLKNFLYQCSTGISEDLNNGQKCHVRKEEGLEGFSIGGGEGPVSASIAVHPNARLENEFLRVPASKVTLSLYDASVLLLSGIEGSMKPFIKIQMKSVRLVLLSNNDGLPLEGSRLKIKDASVALLRYSKRPQSVDSERTTFTWNLAEHSSGFGLEQNRFGNPETGDSSFSLYTSQPSRYSLPHRCQSDQAPNRSGNISLESTETLLHLQIVSIKLPSFEQNRIVLNVPDVTIDCSLESLIFFALLCPELELTPFTGPPLDVLQENEVLLFPDVEAILGSVSLRTRIETTAALLSEHDAVRNHATIRLSGHGKFIITENLSLWDVRMKAGGDVVDEEKGICDPILSPSALSAEVRTVEEMYMKIGAQHFVRIALSPLIVRAVAGIGSTASKVVEKYKTRIIETQNDCYEGKGILNGMRVHLSIPGFVIRCLAEQPRAQLLRLVFRDVRCFVHLPTSISDEGKADLSVRDVIIEDTISPHLRESGVREPRSRSSFTILTSPEDNAGVDERPLLLSETDSICASPLRHQSQQDRCGPKPVFYCLLSWYTPFEQVSAHIGGRGIDIAVNLGMLPTFAEWFETLVHEWAAVQRAQHHRLRSKTRSPLTATGPSFPLAIDHIVIEPLKIKISVSAPPKDLQRSWVQRTLAWIVSAERADGMMIVLPKVVFTGDFSSIQQCLDTFRSSYMRALLSRHMLKQIVWQAPQVVRLGRVLGTSWARRRSRLALIAGEERSVERRGPTPTASRDIGLVGALTNVQYGLATHIRAVHDIRSTEDEVSQPVSPTQLSSGNGQVIQTIDITDSRHHARTEDASQDGKSLFLWLRSHDHRIPRNERFENSFSFSTAVSMIMTSRYLLFVNRSVRAIQEPIITRANIAEFHITGPRITIVTVLSDSISPARFAARQRERDSPSLAKYLRASPRISQIQMHEIECTSPQYASWLLQQLPQPNETLRSRLYR